MENLTRLFTVVTVLLVLVLIVAVIPTEKEGAIYEDTLRLHILANSDSASDQGLKLKIRDKLLEKYGTALRELGSKSEAVEKISSLKEDIERDVNGWISEEGYDYTGHVSLGTEWYERRNYGDFSLPEGYYTSLKVNLGDSDGQNWWCVMYPPLCLDIATESAPPDDALCEYSKEEISLIGNRRYTVKFKLLELTSEIFASARR